MCFCFERIVEYLTSLLRIRGFPCSNPSQKPEVLNQCLCDLSNWVSSEIAEYVKIDKSFFQLITAIIIFDSV
jgi:hypothetical protein